MDLTKYAEVLHYNTGRLPLFSFGHHCFFRHNDQLSQASAISNYFCFPLRVSDGKISAVLYSLPVVNILSLWDNAGNASKNSDSDCSCHWIIWVHHRVNALQKFIHIQNLIQMFFTLLGDLKNAKPKKVTSENKRTEVASVF